MATFILRRIDADFWTAVQTKAAAEGTTVKAVILRLLATWLAAIVILSLSAGCAYHAPTGPTALPTSTPQTLTATSLRVTVSSRPDRSSDVIVTALSADGSHVPGVLVTFAIADGTVTPDHAETNALGVAQTIAGSSVGTLVTITSASLSASTKIDGVPVAVTPPPYVPPPTPSLPGPSIALMAISTTVDVPTFFTVGGSMPGGTSITSSAWTFGDGGSASIPTYGLMHTYANAGTFTVNVTATDALGRSASTSAQVTVKPVPPTPPDPVVPPPALIVTLVCTAATHATPTVCNVAVGYRGIVLPTSAITSVTWDWSDGSTTTTTAPTAPLGARTYAQAGTYLVVATVTAATVDGPIIGSTSKSVIVP